MSLTPKITQRRDVRSVFDRFKVGKLVPVHAVPVRTGEAGVLTQSLRLELDPIPGRLVTPVHTEVYVVYSPAQAIDAIHDPESDYVGLTEVMRQRYLSGNPLYSLEPEGEISQRCDIVPVSIGGVKKVCPSIRYAYAAAVNHLRLRLYNRAQLLDNTNTGITPALLSSTILQRLNGVLDPDDRINGQIAFDLPEADLRVRGVGIKGGSVGDAGEVIETGGDAVTYSKSRHARADTPNGVYVAVDDSGSSPAPDIWAEFRGIGSEGISFTDFYNAQRKDAFVRSMDAVIKANPEYGEEMVLRMVHGLQVDTGKTPMVLHHVKRTFGGATVQATDKAGVEGDVLRSDGVLEISYSLPVPRTELGGVIMTLVSVKPDEVIPAQPHPFAAYPWVADNYVADELKLDPVPVTMRDLDAEVASGSENTPAFYIGYNGLKRNYAHFGVSRRLDPELIDNKMMIYQLEIPMSVTPENILYPEDFTQHVFADGEAEVVACFTHSAFAARTQTVFGPTPYETVELVDGEDIFEEDAE